MITVTRRGTSADPTRKKLAAIEASRRPSPVPSPNSPVPALPSMRMIALASVVILFVTAPTAQQRPDLSGSWVASSEAPSGVAPAPSPTLGARLWLRHEGERLTVVRPVRETTIGTTLPLDGREVRTRITGGPCQGDAEVIETAAWDGAGVVVTQVGSIPAGAGTPSRMNVKRLLRLQSPDLLVIEVTMRSSALGESRQVATVYKRSSDPIPAADAPKRGSSVTATLAQVAWIAGAWIGTDGPTTVEERWTPANGGSMLATARTLRGTSMSSFEFLCIAERHGSLVYTAMPNARTPPTDFMLTTVTADSATFENPAHDFPKAIRYSRLPDGSLETTITGDAKQRPQTVVLKRQ